MTPYAATAETRTAAGTAEQEAMQKTAIRLYDSHQIAELDWPETEQGQYAKRYLLPLLTASTAAYMRNAHIPLAVIEMNGMLLPITIGDKGYDNTYTCSPYTHYVSYAKEELVHIPGTWLRKTLGAVVDGLGLLLRGAKFNRCILVNNWLLSTNLYPRPLEDEEIRALVAFLRDRFPTHVIVLRSLTDGLHAAMLARCRAAGARLVPSRQVYMLHPSDPTQQSSKARWLVKRDYALLQQHGYTVVPPEQIEASDVPRIVELYSMLYLDKYSRWNPAMTEAYVELARTEQTLYLYGLRKNGRLDAVLGFFCRDGVMTTPLFGYDTSMDQSIGLYRMLSAVLIGLAHDNGHLLHESSGAAQFKRNRGASAQIEYNAVFPSKQRQPANVVWVALEQLLTRVGIPLLRKYKL